MIKNRLILFVANLRKLKKHKYSLMKSPEGHDIYGVLVETYINLSGDDLKDWAGGFFPPRKVIEFFGLKGNAQRFKDGNGWSSASFEEAAERVENEIINNQ